MLDGSITDGSMFDGSMFDGSMFPYTDRLGGYDRPEVS